MVKLIFRYYWHDEFVASGYDTIPFEYSSKEDFQYYVLELISEAKKKDPKYYRNGGITLFGNYDLSYGDLEDSIEHGVYTYDEWFEEYKCKV